MTRGRSITACLQVCLCLHASNTGCAFAPSNLSVVKLCTVPFQLPRVAVREVIYSESVSKA